MTSSEELLLRNSTCDRIGIFWLRDTLSIRISRIPVILTFTLSIIFSVSVVLHCQYGCYGTIISKHILICGIWQNLVLHVLLTISAHVKLIHIAGYWVECILSSWISSQDPIHQVGEGLGVVTSLQSSWRGPATSNTMPLWVSCPWWLEGSGGKEGGRQYPWFCHTQCHLSANFIHGMAHLILRCLGSGLPHLQGPCPSPAPGAATLKALYLGETSFSATLQQLLVHATCLWHGHCLPVHRVTTILSIYGVVAFQNSFFPGFYMCTLWSLSSRVI